MKRSVLLVDDEEKLLRGLQHVLRKEDFNIHTATSAADALRVLSAERIDVIISDERMPGVSGSDLLIKVRKEQPDVVLILLTGQARSEQIVRAVNEADIYRFLQKPCSGLDLLITVRRACEYKEILETAAQLTAVAHHQAKMLGRLNREHRDILDSVRQSMTAVPLTLKRLGRAAALQEMHQAVSQARQFFGDFHWDAASTGSETVTHVDPPDTASASLQENAEPASAVHTSSMQANPAGSELEQIDEVHSLKELKPLMSRSAIQELLDECSELKAMSPTVSQLLKLTQNDRYSMDQLVRVIKQDHAISLKLLKLANSSAYTRGEPVDSVQKAVMRIGISQIRQAVMNISVIERFSLEDQCGWLSSPMFWEHAIATGLIAAELAQAQGERDSGADIAFTMGLLHDVGRMVYFEALGDRYRQVLEAAEQLQLPLEQIESRVLLVNHADAMDRILHKWRFAKELINPIALHQLSLGNIRRLSPRSLNEVATLGLANRLAHALLLGTSGNVSLYPTEDFIEALGIKQATLHVIENDLPSQANDMKFAMLASTGVAAWPCLRDKLLERLCTEFRPLHLSMEPTFDATRMFCDRLRTGDPEAAPNIGIIYIRRGQERVPVTTRFLQAEQQANARNLPLVILSPKGDITLEDREMANRQFSVLPMPVHIPRLLDACDALLVQNSPANRRA